ncbi:MAG: ATP-dependent Clp protease ATP-binding subunit ClpC [Parcubacteria group bacterium Gr01-1014_2]|nr:MAG: ATP-dependent Clp protease ATP-binding subunit ClpC [Parcubacteria group bacterium Gr01-1014_2]
MNVCDECSARGVSFDFGGSSPNKRDNPKKKSGPLTDSTSSPRAGSGRGRDPFGFGSIFGNDIFGDIFNDIFEAEPRVQERVDTQDYISESAKQVLGEAEKYAKDFGSREIDSEHLLLALLSDHLIKKVLNNLRISETEIRSMLEKNIEKGVDQEELEYSPRMKRVLDLALPEAQSLRHSYVGPEHLFLALMAEGEGLGARILKKQKLDYEKIKNAVIKVVGRGAKDGFITVMQTPALDQFSRDLTQLARLGKLDPVIGRASEIETAIEVLARRTKNNPVLIGEPGVGKTAIIEGLAQRIVSGNVPEPLQGKRVIELDLSGILAGTQFRGQFEERLKGILDEIKANSDKLIVFIDELHLLVGAGRAEGAVMDAANMFKPALARGELHVVGATTLKEYQKYIEKDAALERRFQPIYVSEPSVSETVEILHGLRDRYESHHRVKILDEAIIGAAELSHRYITGRFLPDKAIDLIDQAASRVRIQFTTEPDELKKIEEKIRGLKKELDAARHAKTKRAGTIEKEIVELEKEKAEKLDEWETKKAKITPEVTFEDVAGVVSKLTGIPVSEMTQAEKEKLINLEARIHERLIDQEEAVKAVAQAIRRGRAGLGDINRPIASFLFLGPTGVGKTELGRTLAQILFGDDQAMVRLDMSEYMEKHNVSRLIGAPPGYVGYDEGGQLTETVRRRPHSIILLDEVEKAHPDVFNILLQVLEDGRLTDGQGRQVNFANTIIIATSNVGSEIIHSQFDKSPSDRLNYDALKDLLIKNLRVYFRPEFLNRLDEIIVFKSLEREQIQKIVVSQLEKLTQKLKMLGYKLDVSSRAIKELASQGFDPHFGARELRRVIQREVENRISEILLKEEPERGSSIEVDFSKEFEVKIKEQVRH